MRMNRRCIGDCRVTFTTENFTLKRSLLNWMFNLCEMQLVYCSMSSHLVKIILDCLNKCIHLVDKNYIFTVIINTFYKSTECFREVKFRFGMTVSEQQLLVTGLRMSEAFCT